MHIRVLFLAVLLGLSGCKSARNTPPSFTGIWSIVAEDRGSGPAGTLELKADGNFVAKRLPTDVIGDAGPFTEQDVTGSGGWSLKHDGDANLVMLHFNRIEAKDHPPLPYDAEIFYEHTGNGLQLYFKDGDPDDDERTILRRDDEGLR